MSNSADIIVIGGGLGGCMAALAAAKAGTRVILTEETDWLGGQLTSQAVPPDEHPWIESFGCTATYREFRNRIRRYYYDEYPLKPEVRDNPRLNPGNGWVSRLCHEPRAALRVLNDMLAPFVSNGRVLVCYGYRPVEAETDGDFVKSVTVFNDSTGDRLTLRGSFFLDATECGDLLPLAGVEYVTGSEARAETGEPHAAESADPLDIQSVTHVFAMDYIEDGNFTIPKPEQYDFWCTYVPSFSTVPILSWMMPDANSEERMKEWSFMPDGVNPMPLWTYRRIIDASIFADGFYECDITLVNWAQNDYFLGPVYDVPEEERRINLAGARQLSLSLMYWLQTEAPRPDGGKGYPGLRLRPDVLGTEDGLAKQPYIRESRRIKAVYTVTENDVSREVRGDQGIRRYKDSVGIGHYWLDLHPTTRTNKMCFIPTYPYEIPLGALLPIRLKNLLPAGKNIGTTQIANGCYRLHPTEWNIGESAGCLAAYAFQNEVTPHEVHGKPHHLQKYLELLEQQGIQTHWPEDMTL
ncbi:FAD-dependent oxidoreductase [Cohnella pontilimi]|uniref:FAD-dependent oxidoreductase n=1 Tax=Cohnella pontilimi TaxID=2564100 RepID=A0A4U0FJ92_9BACL|nr:FAD-dependent oxidoreductase [Cohnella pontilimi]TJY44544.1 FAD-dependent oxidoreductase [Cohnella pontilimi]